MLLLVYSCFFASGLTGLLFEVLWTRQLTREMGGASFAVSVVLTVFMAGLGLGAFAGGRLADRLSARDNRRLLMAYGTVEAAAALLALLVPFWLKLWHAPLAWAYARYLGGFLPFQLVVLAASVMALLPPALAMGMSLPLLTRFCSATQSRLGRHFGGLYACNTLGAAAGALLAGFVLIPAFGLPFTRGFGVAVNLIIAAVCFAAARRADRSPASSESRKTAPKAEEKNPAQIRREAFFAAGLLALSGFCALAYEVLWTKLLALIFGPTTYAFTVVLAAFITGLALGGWVFGRVADRSPRLFAWLLATQGAAALLALAASQRMGNSLTFFLKALLHYHERFGMLTAVKSVYVFLLLLGPTFFFGAALPLASKLWGRHRVAVGKTVGDTYLWNTAGAVLGSWCAGFVFLPALGKEPSLKLLAALQAGATLALLWAGFFRLRAALPGNKKPVFLAAGTSVAALLLCFAWPKWPRESLARVNSANVDPALGSLSWVQAAFTSQALATGRGSLEYFGDGLEGFTAVWKEQDLLGNVMLSLFLSGKADASSRTDMFTQTLLAHFPMAVVPDPKDVMVMGLASGTTAGEVLHYPVRRVDVVEINPKVLEAARRFAPWNNGVLQDPRAHIYVQDAKAHLLLSGRRYDAIISEPSNPWMAGLAELFTVEFYQRARASLNPGGAMVQFIHSYKMDWETLCLVGRTFQTVFPNSILVRTMPDDRPVTDMASDYLLVGFNGSDPWSVADTPEKRRHMGSSRNVEIITPRLMSRLVVAENLGEIFGAGSLHTDDHPVLEFQAPRLMFTFQSARIEGEIAARARLTPRIAAEIAAQKADPAMRLAFGAYALSLFKPFPGMAAMTGATPELRENYAKRVEIYCSNDVVGDYTPFMEDPEILRRCSVYQMGVLNRALPNSPDKAQIYLEMSNACMANGVLRNALKFLRAAAEAAPGTPMADYALEQEARIRAALPPESPEPAPGSQSEPLPKGP